MSRIARGLLLPHLAGSRRAYSFFSNSNGGRYFTASKTAKVLAPNTKTSANKTVGSSTAAGAADASTTTSPASPGSDRNVPVGGGQDAVDELSSTGSPSGSNTASGDAAASHVKANPLGSAVHANLHANAESLGTSEASSSPFPIAGLPNLKPHELKLHHFFSLHRPYLLLDQSVSKLFESHPNGKATPSDNAPNALLGTIDDPPEASPEADADAARQLSRALVVNRVGNTVNWDQTLARLGLHAEMEVPALEDVRIDLDSTKRKRRRKMKKHKLKKRRRLSRATRLRLGK